MMCGHYHRLHFLYASISATPRIVDPHVSNLHLTTAYTKHTILFQVLTWTKRFSLLFTEKKNCFYCGKVTTFLPVRSYQYQKMS